MIGFIPEDVLTWLSTNNSPFNLALANSIVSAHISVLMHLYDEVQDPWLFEAFDNWLEIEHYLFQLLPPLEAGE